MFFIVSFNFLFRLSHSSFILSKYLYQGVIYLLTASSRKKHNISCSVVPKLSRRKAASCKVRSIALKLKLYRENCFLPVVCNNSAQLIPVTLYWSIFIPPGKQACGLTATLPYIYFISF